MLIPKPEQDNPINEKDNNRIIIKQDTVVVKNHNNDITSSTINVSKQCGKYLLRSRMKEILFQWVPHVF